MFSAESIIIGGYDRAKVKTDIAAKLPYGTYGRIAPEPELAINSFIGIGADVIDADFTGNIECVIFNHSDDPFAVTNRMKIAQLIIEKISYPEIAEVDSLVETGRGEKGFGSTGN